MRTNLRLFSALLLFFIVDILTTSLQNVSWISLLCFTGYNIYTLQQILKSMFIKNCHLSFFDSYRFLNLNRGMHSFHLFSITPNHKYYEQVYLTGEWYVTCSMCVNNITNNACQYPHFGNCMLKREICGLSYLLLKRFWWLWLFSVFRLCLL